MRRRRRGSLLAVSGGVAVFATLGAYVGASYAASMSCVQVPLPADDQNPDQGPTAVNFAASNDGWIVGSTWGTDTDCEGEGFPWAEHWNGSSWTDTSVPQVDCRAQLAGVVAQSPTNAWAVGTGRQADIGLAFHWNGARWVSTPSPTPYDEFLVAVDATARSHVWAVGSRSGHAAVFRRANGAWQPMKLPSPAGATGSALTSVAVVSDTNVWVAGSYYPQRGQRTMVLHWNGTKWTVQQTPNPRMINEFTAIDARSASDVWAVGYDVVKVGSSVADTVYQTLTAHWNGAKWTRVTTPNPGSDQLSGVAVRSGGGAWAVGTIKSSSGAAQTLVLRYGSGKWTVVASPNPNAGAHVGDSLSAVAALPNGHAYAVGTMPTSPDASSTDQNALAMTC